ncbi:MAG: M48 family metalloprotease [Candidatus Aminicenantes bacterium]|nr:M48 family metalloprotease [Candidatus Aminicenantes bacterium]
MNPPVDFYELQKRQKIRSAAVVALLLVFYIVAVGLLLLAAWLTFGLFSVRPAGSGFWLKFAVADIVFAGAIAAIHYFDAKKSGAAFLLKRLSAKPPDLSDRYHRLFADAVEAVRIAAGIPRADPLVLPTLSLNSLALIHPNGRPAIVVTEGLLAECTRDEVEAVVAHEAAHIARGDTKILTLVCGLSSFFERLRDALEPDHDVPAAPSFRRRGSGGGAGFLYIAAFLGTGIIRLLGVFVSRERELLADAAAVEFGRSPMALARAIYKARSRNVFIGDFSQAYAPLFLIAPSGPGEAGAPVPRWISSHPPFKERIDLLAGMAHQSAEAVSEQVREGRELRERSRTIAPASPTPAPPPGSKPPEMPEWVLLRRDGSEQGPLSLAGLVEDKDFTPAVRVRNLVEGLDGRAGDFPQVRDAIRRKRQGRPAGPVRFNLCPRCRIPLGSTHYEGVPVRVCRRCGGKLVDLPDMNRIIARREVGFAQEIVRKADIFEKEHRLDPAAPKTKTNRPDIRLTCPACGFQMRSRPYNYQYFVPVDKCLSCGRVWFDADELEILQILIERTRKD